MPPQVFYSILSALDRIDIHAVPSGFSDPAAQTRRTWLTHTPVGHVRRHHVGVSPLSYDIDMAGRCRIPMGEDAEDANRRAPSGPDSGRVVPALPPPADRLTP